MAVTSDNSRGLGRDDLVWGMKIHPWVFFPAAGIILLFVVLGVAFPGAMESNFTRLQTLIVNRFGWFYTLAVSGFLVFTIWLFFSPYGAIRLGKDTDTPDYSYATWFAMLFSAGMGIGLLFYSVAEPMIHFGAPPMAEPRTIAAAQEALRISFMHWGLHAWGIYIVVGVALAYFAYRHDLPLTIRSTLYPLLGDRIHGFIGNAVEVMAVFGTLFGVATSLGLGVMQINAGMEYLGLIDISTTNQIILIATITAAATASVVSGLDRGIRRLSELNLLAGLVLVLFVFGFGPTTFLLQSFVQSVGGYVQHIVGMSLDTDAYVGVQWQKSWTMFYWGWWISWSPFVGMFIARISRGRTIREFVGGVLLVPSLLTFIWMVVFGNTAIHMELFGSGGIAAAVSENVSTALFVMLDKLPLAAVTSAIATLVVATFFVTSSDSGSLVIDILTSGGDPDPPVTTRVFWALTEGAVAATLLLTGGLTALQTAAITTAMPFSIIIVVICFSMVAGLRMDRAHAALQRHRLGAIGAEAVEAYGSTPPEDDEDWRVALNELLHGRGHLRTYPEAALHASAGQLDEFLEQVVLPAFHDLRHELRRHGREAVVRREGREASITVVHDGKEAFYYGIRCHAYRRMRFAFPELGNPDEPRDYSAEVVLRSGTQERRELTAFTRKAIIGDFLEEYGKWMGW